MVDSGSDVVTLRQIVLDTMDLELIGPINSKGVHASRVKNLYKAYILLGSEKIEVEVNSSSWLSVCCVICTISYNFFLELLSLLFSRGLFIFY